MGDGDAQNSVTHGGIPRQGDANCPKKNQLHISTIAGRNNPVQMRGQGFVMSRIVNKGAIESSEVLPTGISN